MTKVILKIGYDRFVMDADKAVAVLDLLSEAETYEEKWRSKEDGGSTFHVYDNKVLEEATMQIMPLSRYRMAKLAGKPTD